MLCQNEKLNISLT